MSIYIIDYWRQRFPDETAGKDDRQIALAILAAHPAYAARYPDLLKLRKESQIIQDRSTGAAFDRHTVAGYQEKLRQNAPEDRGLIQTYLSDPVRRGILQSKQADLIMNFTGPDDSLTREEVSKLVDIRGQLQALEMSPHMKEFQEASGFWKSWGEFWGWKETPAILSEVTTESLSALLSHGWEKILAGAGGGAATAAALGQIGPQVGLPEEIITVPTAAMWGAATGMGKTSYNLSATGKYLEVIEKAVGHEVMSDPNLLFNAINDPDVIRKARSKAQAHGIPIGLFDTISMGLAGRVTNVANRVANIAGRRAATPVGRESLIGNAARIGLLGTEKVAPHAIPTGFQMSMGAGGEALGQVFSEGKVDNWKDVFLEGVAELGFAPFEMAAGHLTRDTSPEHHAALGDGIRRKMKDGFNADEQRAEVEKMDELHPDQKAFYLDYIDQVFEAEHRGTVPDLEKDAKRKPEGSREDWIRALNELVERARDGDEGIDPSDLVRRASEELGISLENEFLVADNEAIIKAYVDSDDAQKKKMVRFEDVEIRTLTPEGVQKLTAEDKAVVPVSDPEARDTPPVREDAPEEITDEVKESAKRKITDSKELADRKLFAEVGIEAPDSQLDSWDTGIVMLDLDDDSAMALYDWMDSAIDKGDKRPYVELFDEAMAGISVTVEEQGKVEALARWLDRRKSDTGSETVAEDDIPFGEGKERGRVKVVPDEYLGGVRFEHGIEDEGVSEAEVEKFVAAEEKAGGAGAAEEQSDIERYGFDQPKSREQVISEKLAAELQSGELPTSDVLHDINETAKKRAAEERASRAIEKFEEAEARKAGKDDFSDLPLFSGRPEQKAINVTDEDRLKSAKHELNSALKRLNDKKHAMTPEMLMLHEEKIKGLAKKVHVLEGVVRGRREGDISMSHPVFSQSVTDNLSEDDYGLWARSGGRTVLKPDQSGVMDVSILEALRRIASKHASNWINSYGVEAADWAWDAYTEVLKEIQGRVDKAREHGRDYRSIEEGIPMLKKFSGERMLESRLFDRLRKAKSDRERVSEARTGKRREGHGGGRWPMQTRSDLAAADESVTEALVEEQAGEEIHADIASPEQINDIVTKADWIFQKNANPTPASIRMEEEAKAKIKDFLGEFIEILFGGDKLGQMPEWSAGALKREIVREVIFPELARAMEQNVKSLNQLPGKKTRLKSIFKEIVSIEKKLSRLNGERATKTVKVLKSYFTQISAGELFSEEALAAESAADIAAGTEPITPDTTVKHTSPLPAYIDVLRSQGVFMPDDNFEIEVLASGGSNQVVSVKINDLIRTLHARERILNTEKERLTESIATIQDAMPSTRGFQVNNVLREIKKRYSKYNRQRSKMDLVLLDYARDKWGPYKLKGGNNVKSEYLKLQQRIQGAFLEAMLYHGMTSEEVSLTAREAGIFGEGEEAFGKVEFGDTPDMLDRLKPFMELGKGHFGILEAFEHIISKLNPTQRKWAMRFEPLIRLAQDTKKFPTQVFLAKIDSPKGSRGPGGFYDSASDQIILDPRRIPSDIRAFKLLLEEYIHSLTVQSVLRDDVAHERIKKLLGRATSAYKNRGPEFEELNPYFLKNVHELMAHVLFDEGVRDFLSTVEPTHSGMVAWYKGLLGKIWNAIISAIGISEREGTLLHEVLESTSLAITERVDRTPFKERRGDGRVSPEFGLLKVSQMPGALEYEENIVSLPNHFFAVDKSTRVESTVEPVDPKAFFEKLRSDLKSREALAEGVDLPGDRGGRDRQLNDAFDASFAGKLTPEQRELLHEFNESWQEDVPVENRNLARVDNAYDAIRTILNTSISPYNKEVARVLLHIASKSQGTLKKVTLKEFSKKDLADIPDGYLGWYTYTEDHGEIEVRSKTDESSILHEISHAFMVQSVTLSIDNTFEGVGLELAMENSFMLGHDKELSRYISDKIRSRPNSSPRDLAVADLIDVFTDLSHHPAVIEASELDLGHRHPDPESLDDVEISAAHFLWYRYGMSSIHEFAVAVLAEPQLQKALLLLDSSSESASGKIPWIDADYLLGRLKDIIRRVLGLERNELLLFDRSVSASIRLSDPDAFHSTFVFERDPDIQTDIDYSTPPSGKEWGGFGTTRQGKLFRRRSIGPDSAEAFGEGVDLPASDLPSEVVYEDVKGMTAPPEKYEGTVSREMSWWDRFKERFVTRSGPLDTLMGMIFKDNHIAGKPRVTLAELDELQAGSPVKADLRVSNFESEIFDIIGGSKDVIDEWNAFIVNMRVQDRLKSGAKAAHASRIEELMGKINEDGHWSGTDEEKFELINLTVRSKEVGKYKTLDDARALGGAQEVLMERLNNPELLRHALDADGNILRDRVTGNALYEGKFVEAAETYHGHLSDALFDMYGAGILTPQAYNRIARSTSFYLPFYVLKYFNRDPKDTFGEYIKGIKNDDFKILNPIDAARFKLYVTQLRTDRNVYMNRLELFRQDFDPDGKYILKVDDLKDVRGDMEEVKFYENGKVKYLVFDKEIARLLKHFDPVSTTQTYTAMKTAGDIFKLGATGINAFFQVGNFLLADPIRLLTTSKAGLRAKDKGLSPIILAMQYFKAFAAASWANLTPNSIKNLIRKFAPDKTHDLDALYNRFVNSGAAGSTIAEYFAKPTAVKDPLSRHDTGRRNPLVWVNSKLSQLGKTLEQTAKMVGLQRLEIFEGIDGMLAEMEAENNPEKKQALKNRLDNVMDEIAVEIRNYAGSPDFIRKGSWTESEALNVVFMFFNARVQGVERDLSRLSKVFSEDKKDRGTAMATMMKISAVAALPTIAAWAMNRRDEERERDYEEVSEEERRRYFMIPLDEWFDHPYIEGKRVRDYIRIPRRESYGLFSYTLEKALDWMNGEDREALNEMLGFWLESTFPINVEGVMSGDPVKALESMGSSMNPLIKGTAEQMSNRNFFRHKPIIPISMEKADSSEQYFETTPDLYKTMGSMSGLSPLRIKHFVETITASGVTQFIPPKNVGEGGDIGRSLASTPLLSRLARSTFIESSDLDEIINDEHMEDATARVIRRRMSDKFMRETRGMSVQDRVRLLKPARNNNEKLLNDLIIRRLREVALGLEPEEIRLKRSSVNVRSSVVLKKMRGMPPAQVKIYLADLARKGIITQDVANDMMYKMRLRGETIHDYTREPAK